MKAGTNQTVPEEAKPILQVKRPLLLIDEYAAREGVSRNIIEECGRLGIVQIRKYKGQTYVVDVPISPYYQTVEGRPILQESLNMDAQASKRQTQPIDKVAYAQKISGLAPKVTPDEYNIPAQPIKSDANRAKADAASTLAKRLVSKASKIRSQLAQKIKHVTDHPANISKPAQIARSSQPQLDGFAEQARTKRAWQVAALSSAVCLFVAFLAVLWLYMNQRVHGGRLDQARANIKTMYDDFVGASQQLAALQSKLVEYTAELELVKNESNSSRAEIQNVQATVKTLQDELTQARQGLQTIQQHNATALEQLREQLQQLTTQLSEFIKNSQPSSSSTVSGR